MQSICTTGRSFTDSINHRQLNPGASIKSCDPQIWPSQWTKCFGLLPLMQMRIENENANVLQRKRKFTGYFVEISLEQLIIKY